MSLYGEPSLLGLKVGKRSADPALTYRRVEDLTLQTQQRNTSQAHTAMGKYESAPPRPLAKFPIVGYTMEMLGHTVAADPITPPWAPALRARGFSETQTGAAATKSYTYVRGDPHLDSTHTTGGPTGDCDAISYIVNVDGRAYSIDNTVSDSIAIAFMAGEIAKVIVSARGVITATSVAPTDAQAVTLTAEPVLPVYWNTAAYTITPDGESALSAALLVESTILTFSGGLNESKSASGAEGFAQPRLGMTQTDLTMAVHETLLATWDIEDVMHDEQECAFSWVLDPSGGNGKKMTFTGDYKLKDIGDLYLADGNVWMRRLRWQESQDTSATPTTITIMST